MTDRDDTAVRASGQGLVGLHIEDQHALLAGAHVEDMQALDTEHCISARTPGGRGHTHTVSHRQGLSRSAAWSPPIVKGPDAFSIP